MKSLMIALVALFSAHAALADSGTLVCIAGQTKADGTFSIVSGNPANVVVLQNGSISAYTLKDAFSLYNTHYSVKNPFDMSLVSDLGAAGSVQVSGTALSASWTLSDDGKQKVSISVTADSSALTGQITTSTTNDADGSWAGTTGPDPVVCSTAGLK